MVRIIPSSVFVKDPVDVWNREHTIGNAELAARLGSLMVFDKRGDVLFCDDYESATAKYSNTDGTVARSVSRARNGNFSLKCVTGATSGSRSGPYYSHSDFHTDTKMGIQTTFATADDVWGIILAISYYVSTAHYIWSIRLKSDGTVQYGDSTGNWQDVTPTMEYEQDDYNFATVKVVGDLSTKKYVRAVLFNQEYDLSGFDCYSTVVPSTNPYLYTSFAIETLENVAKTAYFDSYVLTENEPA